MSQILGSCKMSPVISDCREARCGWVIATRVRQMRLAHRRMVRRRSHLGTGADMTRVVPGKSGAAGKPAARICQRKAKWSRYSTTIIRLGHVDWRHGRGQPRHKAILVSAACCQHYCKRHKNDQKSTHSKELPTNSIAIMKRLTPDALALSSPRKCRRVQCRLLGLQSRKDRPTQSPKSIFLVFPSKSANRVVTLEKCTACV